MANDVSKIEEKIDKSITTGMAVNEKGISFSSASEVMEFAKMMAVSGSAVPSFLRGQPGACLGIIDDAIRFGFSPYALARKSYFVNDNLAYEAQVLSAIVCARAPFRERPEILFEGEGDERICIVVFRFNTGEDREYRSPVFKKIHPKNSPLWKSDPDQQHAYYSIRAGARRHCSDVLLGIYDFEEMAAARARDVTPRDPRPNLIGALDRLAGPTTQRHDEAAADETVDEDGVVGEKVEGEGKSQAGATATAQGEGKKEPAGAAANAPANDPAAGAAGPEPKEAKADKSAKDKAEGAGDRNPKNGLPLTERGYIEYANEWIADCAPTEVRNIWTAKEQKDIRNKCNVSPETRESIYALVLAREAVGSKEAE